MRRTTATLALQGGGSHGAFTWGVLDHLLEDGRLTIEGISGASAGAVNAIMMDIVLDGMSATSIERTRKELELVKDNLRSAIARNTNQQQAIAG